MELTRAKQTAVYAVAAAMLMDSHSGPADAATTLLTAAAAAGTETAAGSALQRGKALCEGRWLMLCPCTLWSCPLAVLRMLTPQWEIV